MRRSSSSVSAARMYPLARKTIASNGVAEVGTSAAIRSITRRSLAMKTALKRSSLVGKWW